MPPCPTADALRAALALDGFDARAAQRLMEPERRGRPPPATAGRPLRAAGALAYAFEREGRIRLPFTLRRRDVPEHGGQVSLPGGRPGPGEDLWETAVREAREEIGLDVGGMRRLGQLAPVRIPVSHSLLSVFVAWGPDPQTFVPCPREVERVVVVTLDDLVDPARRAVCRMRIDGAEVDVPYYDVEGLVLWGATAMAVSELCERLTTSPGVRGERGGR